MAEPKKPTAPKKPEVTPPEVKGRKVNVKNKQGKEMTVSRDYFEKYSHVLTVVK